MANKGTFTKILAVVGTLLVWFPVLAPVFFSLAGLLRSGRFHFDYLMPAELGTFGLVGAGLLIWAAVRARAYWKLICWGIGSAMVVVILGQVLAMVTGLASGRTEPTGWQWVLVLGLILLFPVGLAVTGVGGILLLRNLFRTNR
jgi:hypothetical protein